MRDLYNYTDHKVFSKVQDLNCFIYEQGIEEYKIYLFYYQFNNEEELLNNYEKINDIIAFNFQSELKKNIEKWNVYFFLFVSNTTTNATKVLVEQNKYATRKIVIDKPTNSLSEQKKIIKNKLFLDDLVILGENKELNNIGEIGPEGTLDYLLQRLRELPTTKKKKEISSYLKEVMKYES